MRMDLLYHYGTCDLVRVAVTDCQFHLPVFDATTVLFVQGA